MSLTLTIDDIRSRLSSTNIECTDDSYKSPHLNLNFKCKDGHEFRMSWNEIQNVIGAKPPQCPICRGKFGHKDKENQIAFQIAKDLKTEETKIRKISRSIKDCKVKDKYLRKNRWYVKFSPSFNGTKVLPNANYVWLLGNPAFFDRPKGYVIHHLDGDTLNDDISNLVIMQKFHHVAYHWKHKIKETETNVRTDFLEVKRNMYYPLTEPRIKEYRTGRFRLRFRENINGKLQRAQIYSWEGVVITSREMAEKIKSLIWEKQKS